MVVETGALMARLLVFTCANALPHSRADGPVTCTFPASNKAQLSGTAVYPPVRQADTETP